MPKMTKRWKQVLIVGLALGAALGGPNAAAQGEDEPRSQSAQLMDLIVENGVLEVVEVPDGQPTFVVPRPDGSAPDLAVRIIGASSTVMPLDQLDVNGDGFVSIDDLLRTADGSAVGVPPGGATRGAPFTFVGAGSRRTITLTFPQTDDHITAGGELVWTTIETNVAYWQLPGVAEVGLWYDIPGLPVLEAIDGVNLPGVGNGFAIGSVFQDGTPMPTYAQVDAATGQPINYQPAHIIGWWEELGRYFTVFGTGRSDVTFTATASHSPDPQDTSSYVFEEIDLSQVPMTPVEIQQLLESLIAAGVEPSADTDAADDSSADTDAGDDGTAGTTNDSSGAGVVETAAAGSQTASEPEPQESASGGDDGGGFSPAFIAVPLIVGGIVAGRIWYLRRRDAATGETFLEALVPLALGRSATLARELAAEHVESGGAVGPNEMFVPSYRSVAEALSTFPDGDDADVFMLRMLNEHIHGRQLGETLPDELRAEINAHVIPHGDDPELMMLVGDFPNSHFGGVVATVTRDYGRHSFPKDSVIAIHVPSGQAFWVPRSALPAYAPAERGEAMLATTTDEVIVL